MNLGPVTQSEVSQKEKNKYYILTHANRIQKNATDGPICKAGIETRTHRTDVWAQWGEKLREAERAALTRAYGRM